MNETIFKQMLDIAVNYSDDNPKIVMITSWNEWLESTAIEPSVKYGDIARMLVPKMVKNGYKSAFVY